MNLPIQPLSKPASALTARTSSPDVPAAHARDDDESARELLQAGLIHGDEQRRMLMGAPIPMCLMLGPLHVPNLLNEACRHLLGRRDVLGKPLREALPELSDQGFFEMLDKVWTTGEPHQAKEQLVRVPGHPGQAEREVYITFSCQPLRDLQGKAEGVVFLGSDVTEMVAARRTMAEFGRQAQAEALRKDEFLAMLGHELRNPLAALSTALEVMAQRGRRDPHSLGLQARCERQVATLARLLDDLLDVSRITMGKVEIRRDVVDLAAIVQKAFQAVHPQMDARRHETSVTVGPGPFPVDGDSIRLEQVFVNLFANAAKYTDPGGRISVHLGREGSADAPCAVVRVHDTGRGIDEPKLDTIFDLFVQVDSGLDRKDSGLGIGLTLVRQLVAMHGGQVAAESEGLGHGSTFTVRLPIAATVAEPRKATLPPRAGPTERRQVVVVEDNEDARECLQELLRLRGHIVESAADGIAGRDLIRTTHPDVAFIDVGLPGLDGFELVKQLRAAPGTESTRLVAVTGYGGSEGRALEAGFDEYLTKPVTLAQIERVLQASMEVHA